MTAARRDGGGPHGRERDERVTLPHTERLGRKGPGPVLVAILVAAAFLVGVVRPWDWLSPGEGPAATTAAHNAPRGSPAAAPSGPVVSGTAGRAATPAPAPVVDPTCAYPRSWRLAAIQDWGGRTARVWSAADAVVARGPGDPAIPFSAITSTSVTAFGWCAPVSGPDRPPLAATGMLFRIDADGPRELPFDRLEPAAASALGELWMPVPQSIGRRPPWPPGRYVIRLAAPGGSFDRYLGIEVVRVVRDASPMGTAAPESSPEAPPSATSSTPPSP